MSIGIDLVYINRFNNLNENMIKNTFTDNELNYIKSRNYNISTMAGIYAAKEAFLKAIKKGINNYSLKDIEIYHNDNNAPFIEIHGDLENDYQNIKFDVSISHDNEYAIATVIIF